MSATPPDSTTSTRYRERKGSVVFPEPLKDAEWALIRKRRRLVLQDPESHARLMDEDHRFGLALSGGGIRSATFCLGVLQHMARNGMLRAVDYLSTVSGGGYIGGFLGTLFMRGREFVVEETRAGGLDAAAEEKTPPYVHVERLLGCNGSPVIRWLRENGRHLAPNGAGDLLTALAVQLRNWSSVVVVMGISLLSIFLGTQVFRRAIEGTEPLGFWAEMLKIPRGNLWLSPWFLPTFAAVALAVMFAWSYWLISKPAESAGRHLSKSATLVVLILSGWLGLRQKDYVAVAFKCLLVLGLGASVLSMLEWVAGMVSLGIRRPKREWRQSRGVLGRVQHRIFGASFPDERLELWRLLRNRCSVSLKTCMVVAGCLLAFALIDTFGQSLYLAFTRGANLRTALMVVWTASGLALVFSFGDKAWAWIERFSGGKKVTPPFELIALAAGIFGVFLFLLNCDVLAHACAWTFKKPGPGAAPDRQLLWTMLSGSVLLAYLFGRNLPFLNASSLQYLYGARLVRAYFGATNPRRHFPRKVAVTDTISGDDLSLSGYAPYKNGGPLHIINVTFNETCSGESQLEQRDRKGLQFAVGPAGLSVGARFHAQWSDDEKHPRGSAIIPIPTGNPNSDFQMFPAPKPLKIFGLVLRKPTVRRQVESLTAGRWIAISGAAFGTGMGRETSLGLSLLAGLANVRLGYWWDSRVRPRERRKNEVVPRKTGRSGRFFSWLLPVQAYLLDEWLARFHGPARRYWYLSDGGHFENTAVYELLRRRVPHAICCDCGADPDYSFADLANLVRKARIDFGAEIRFASKEILRSACPQIPENLIRQIGMPETFRKRLQASRQAHAVLAAVRFGQAADGENQFALILFLKPSLSGDEPLDLWEYDIRQRDFPQESTADQFFDEAQWESCRKLGEHIAANVLGGGQNAGLWFTELCPETVWYRITQGNP
jgi:hypothetical protein